MHKDFFHGAEQQLPNPQTHIAISDLLMHYGVRTQK
jgi:hypothetical protein